jgi:type IV pilus assembly protein PilM
MSRAAARSSFLQVQPPAIAVEFAVDRVAVVSVDRGSRGASVAGHAVERLPPGAITPLLNGRNVHDPAAAGEAVQRALERAGARGPRAALVLPDAVARVSILSFETVPPATKDLDQLIRWQVRKSVPFPIDAAQVSWQRGAGNDFLVAAARRDIVEEYEALCGGAGLHAGIVDLATFDLINMVLASDAAPGERDVTLGGPDSGSDWMLVHVTAGDATIAIVRDGHVIFFRNKATAGDESVEDLVHQTAMYHEDRLGGGRFARVVVRGLSAAASADARRNIEARFGVPMETVDPRSAATLRDRIGVAPDLLEALAAPVGVLVRGVA